MHANVFNQTLPRKVALTNLNLSPSTEEHLRCLGGHSIEVPSTVPTSSTDPPKTLLFEGDIRLPLPL